MAGRQASCAWDDFSSRCRCGASRVDQRRFEIENGRRDSTLTRKSSFPPVVVPDTRLLVLGSLPGERSLAERRYYAHPQNGFWRLMSPVVGTDLSALDYDARLAALLAAGVGLWDVIGHATRRGSSDAAIKDAAANDLPALIATLPALRAIAFNGGTAARIGRATLRPAPTGIALVDLPSSSPLYTIGLAAKQPAWNVLVDFLTKR